MSCQRGGVALAFSAVMMMAAVHAALGQASATSSWRTPWGDPDLRGIWTGATYTPLERPDHFAERELLTEEEHAALNQLLTADGVDPLRARGVLAAESDSERRERTRQTNENIHYDNAVWLTEEQRKDLSTRRTSLITDPPDGKIPPLVPAAEARAAERREASRAGRAFDSYETRPLAERCLVWPHEGPPMLPASYNDLIQIFQTRDHIVLLQEMNDNGPRIVPLDGRPHVPPVIRQWPGDSRGHWEGETLVIDTVNFNGKAPFMGATGDLHVVERFTRRDEEKILYEFTVSDEATWTRPWSAEFPLMKREGPLFEYACHEGNVDLMNILEIARNLDTASSPDSR